MALPSEKFAESLQVLRDLQEKKNLVAIKSSDISRTHRERLIKNGFLKEVTKGWYIASNPNEKLGDSTSWYTSFWQFCSQYLRSKYKEAYCISAEQSILFHSGNNTVPIQLIVRTPEASNTNINLLYNTSILAMTSPLPNIAEISEYDGLRILTLNSSIVNCSPTMFIKNPMDMRIALAQISNASEILNILLDGSHTVIAGRLAGAFRNNGQARIADDIVNAMKSAGFNVREIDPFKNKPITILTLKERSPYESRIKLMWDAMRKVVIKYFPESPGLPQDKEKYLKSIDEIYITDAYHSLSIERYTVSTELIEMVKSGSWDLDKNKENKKKIDAIADRGY